MKASRTFSDAENAFRASGMALSEVTEDFPWGHRALKVRGKAFVFIALGQGTLSLSVKLPDSSGIALSMPFVAPTGYGLGRSGWVTATFDSPSQIPMPVLLSWLEESYRAIAPKRLSRLFSPQALALEGRIEETPGARSRRLASRRRQTGVRETQSECNVDPPELPAALASGPAGKKQRNTRHLPSSRRHTPRRA